MATPNKIDLSLDDIIKLNEKSRGTGGGRGRGRGKGRARSAGQQSTPETKAGGLTQQKTGLKRGRGCGTGGIQQKIQRLREKAKKTTQSKKQQPQQQQNVQSTGVKSTGVKLRLGIRGKGRGLKMGAGTPASGGNKPGSKLKVLRALKLQRANTRGRGRGVANALRQAAGKQVGTPSTPIAQGGRGSGRRGRGLKGSGKEGTPSLPTQGRGRGRHGRGQGLRGSGLENLPSIPIGQRGHGRGRRGRGARGCVATGSQPSLEVFTAPQFEPVGVDIPMVLCAEQHTSKSLHNRFTPRQELRVQSQRMVQQRGRTVNFHS